MQCSNCEFENMPGVEVCGRCGASLNLATAAIDVYPPRAGRWSKRLHLLAPATFRLRQWRMQLASAMASAVGTVALPRPAPGVFRRMVVPGWPQIHCGQVTRGRVFLYAYLAALIPGIFFTGTVLGSLLMGLAISVHASSVLDVVMTATHDLATRILYSLVCFLALAALVYWPTHWLVGRVAVPQRITTAAEPLEVGDVLWYNPSAYRRRPPQVGDVVLYAIPPTRLTGRMRGFNAAYQIEGARIDRVVAGPGQQVEWTKEGPVVDGQPSRWLPLNPARVPTGWNVTVPAGQVCIVPSTTPIPPGAAAAFRRQIARIGLVSIRSVHGKVFFRSQPLWRMGWLR
jgi:signal peptidase I